MSVITWMAHSSGYWRTPADWSGGSIPGAGDNVVLTSPDPLTVTYAAGDAGAVHSITATNDRLAVRGGMLKVGGTVLLQAGLVISRGTLDLLGGGSIQGAGIGGTGELSVGAATSLSGLTQNGGTIAIGAAATLTLSGTDTLLGLGVIDGAGTLATTGTVTLGTSIGPGTYFRIGATWRNSGVLDVAAGASEYDTGSAAGIVNQVGGTVNLNGYYTTFLRSNNISNLVNDGVLAVGTAESNIGELINTGTISIPSGTLELTAGGTLGGTLIGAGTLVLGGAAGTMYVDTALHTSAASTVLLDGGELSVTADSTIAHLVASYYGGLTFSAAATLAVANLVLDGLSYNGLSGEISGGGVYGAGTLATSGTATLGEADSGYNGLLFGGGFTWVNTGSATLLSTIYTGASSPGTAAVTFINTAGAVIYMGQYGGISSANTGSTFTNAGTIDSVGGWIASTMANSGTIAVSAGIFSLDGGGTLDGTIEGAGTLALGGGVFTGSALDTLGSTTLLMSGGTFTVTNSIMVGHLVVGASGNEITISAGDTLKMADLSIDFYDIYFDYDIVIAGSGTLETTGTVTLDNLAPGGYGGAGVGVHTWLNLGTVDVSGSIVVAGTWVNEAGGVFDFFDGAHEVNTFDGTSWFSNAGLLEKTAGSGTVSLDSSLDNTGTVTVLGGTLALYGGGTLDGTIDGAGTLALDGGSFAGSAFDSLSATSLVLSGGTLDVTASGSIAQLTLVSALPPTTTIVISAGTTLTVGTLLENRDYYPDGPSIEGKGTLTTTGVTLLQAIGYPFPPFGDPTYLGGGLTWLNEGTTSISKLLSVQGTSSSGAVHFVNAAGAVFDFAAGSPGIYGDVAGSTFSNAGTVEKTGGGLSSIGTAIANTGLIDARLGTLQLLGTVTGAGTMRIEAASTLELAGSPSEGQTLDFDGSGATLRLDAPASIAQPLQGLGAGDRIDLAGVTLDSASIAGSTLTLDAGATRFVFHSSASLSGVTVELTADRSGGTVAVLSGTQDMAALMFASLQIPIATAAGSGAAAPTTLQAPGGTHATAMVSTPDFSGTWFAFISRH